MRRGGRWRNGLGANTRVTRSNQNTFIQSIFFFTSFRFVGIEKQLRGNEGTRRDGFALVEVTRSRNALFSSYVDVRWLGISDYHEMWWRRSLSLVVIVTSRAFWKVDRYRESSSSDNPIVASSFFFGRSSTVVRSLTERSSEVITRPRRSVSGWKVLTVVAPNHGY